MEEGECELCGRFGKLVEVEIEGSTLLVCEKCAAFGDRPSPKKVTRTRGERVPSSGDEVTSEDLVENYGRLIKKARESEGMTQEELAAKLMIKTTLLSKIEREEITPDIRLARKIEKVLNIKLLEKLQPAEATTEDKDEEGRKKKSGYGITLGDLIKLKKMEKE